MGVSGGAYFPQHWLCVTPDAWQGQNKRDQNCKGLVQSKASWGQWQTQFSSCPTSCTFPPCPNLHRPHRVKHAQHHIHLSLQGFPVGLPTTAWTDGRLPDMQASIVAQVAFWIAWYRAFGWDSCSLCRPAGRLVEGTNSPQPRSLFPVAHIQVHGFYQVELAKKQGDKLCLLAEMDLLVPAHVCRTTGPTVLGVGCPWFCWCPVPNPPSL